MMEESYSNKGLQDGTTKKRNKALILLALVVMVLLAAGVVIRSKSAAIMYHKYRIDALLNEEPEYDESSGLGFYGDEWCRAFDRHRDKLTELGYLVQRDFPLETIKHSSLRFRRLWEEIAQRFPDNPYALGRGNTSSSFAVIAVWDTPEKLPEWERIVKAHDAAPTNEVKISDGQDPSDIEPFIGRWGDEDREVCYIISRDAAGGVTIESPPNEVWRTEFRNVRFKENRITFDLFMYTDPDDKYNSIIEKSGHHPSSGIRLETDFEIDRLDQNELIHKISILCKGMQLTDPNRQIVGVLRRLE